MPRIATRRPNHDHHSPAQQTHGDNPGLAIVTALVGDIQGVAGEYLGGCVFYEVLFDDAGRVSKALGIQLTRRTVAKYREDMGIPSTHQRRRRDG